MLFCGGLAKMQPLLDKKEKSKSLQYLNINFAECKSSKQIIP